MWSKLIELLSSFFNNLQAPVEPVKTEPPAPVTPPSSPPQATTPVTYVQSPNFSSRFNKKVQVIVLHHTGSLSVKSAISWFSTQQSQVSAHYIVDLDGTVTQMVKEADKAWHAGDSVWNGLKNVNAISVGIEIVGDGITPFTDAQYEVVARLSKEIMLRHGLTDGRTQITSHAAIAQPAGRKNDPSPWDWDRFFNLLDK